MNYQRFRDHFFGMKFAYNNIGKGGARLEYLLCTYIIKNRLEG